MVYFASQLIVEAWRTTGMVSADIGNQPSSRQMVDGLNRLNELLSELSLDGALLPYTTNYSFTATIGQEAYPIDNLIQWQTITFDLDTVRYSLQNTGRTDYFGSDRVNNITSLPYQFHVERTLGGSTLYLYFKPSQEFPINIYGLFGFVSVDYNTDLAFSCDLYYLKFLRLALAECLCSYYQMVLPAQIAMELKEIRLKIKNLNAPDMTCQKINLLGNSSLINYAQANIGRGWTPT